MSTGRMMPTKRDTFWTNPRRPTKALAQMIEAALADPDPYTSAEQFTRYHHDDVPSLDLDTIDDERWRLRSAKAFRLISLWGLERLTVLDRESERRRRIRR